MEDRLNLVRQIFNSDAFKNSTDEQRRDIIRQIRATGEVSEVELIQLYEEARSNTFSNNTSNNEQVNAAQASELAKLPYDLFSNIVLSGEIRGEDLLALCNSSKVLQDYCNRPVVLPNGQEISQYLFRQLVEKERPGYIISDQEQPRDVYEKLTTKRLEDFLVLVEFLEILQDHEFMPESEYLPSPQNILTLLYDDQDQWGLLFRSLKLKRGDLGLDRYIKLKRFLDVAYDVLINELQYIVSPETIPTVNQTILPANNMNGAQLIAVNNIPIPLGGLLPGMVPIGGLLPGMVPVGNGIINPLLGIQQLRPVGNNLSSSDTFYLVLNGVSQLWEQTRNFPKILDYLKETLNLNLIEIVIRLTRASSMTTNPAFSILTGLTDADIVNLWQNYEESYKMIIKELLPQDSKELFNLIYDSLIGIVDRYLDYAQNSFDDLTVQEQQQGQQFLPADAAETLATLKQISKDFHEGVYNRIIRWLVKVHQGVLNGQQSILTPVKGPPQ